MDTFSNHTVQKNATNKSQFATCTIISAAQPTTVSKEFRLQPDGELHKQTIAYVTTGRMEIVEFTDLQEFSVILKSLNTNECLMYGVPPHSPTGLVTEEAWKKAGYPSSQIARTNKNINWAPGPGILMLDYDAPKDGKPALNREELFQALFDACPGLRNFDILWWPSTSSCIWHGEKELTGIRGQRLYILAKGAQDIPRAGKAILTKLWVMGYGHFEISKSGSLLEYGLFDASIWQPSRIDFAAGAKCHAPLEQRRGEPVLYKGFYSDPVDSIDVISDPTPEEIALADKNKAAQKVLVSEKAKNIQENWKQERLRELIRRYPNTPREQLEATTVRAVEKRDLSGDWVITVFQNDKPKEVCVSQILDNPQSYHGMHTLDPLEPDYDGGRPVGKLFLNNARPLLNSFAHGGTVFKLSRSLARTEIVKGKERER